MKTFFLFLAFCISTMPVLAQNNNMAINKIQVIGSHNSYKKAIAPELFQFLQQKDSTGALKGLEYEHISIPEQLNLGLRNLEIDIYGDTKGGKYKHPKGLDLVPSKTAYDPEGKMSKPGFKVFHVADIDFRTWVYTFKEALNQLKNWSENHPDHLPVFITIEPKDGKANYFGTVPEPFTIELFDAMDEEIKSHLGIDNLITPDMVRGDYNTLNEAISQGNWPLLKEAKGKFLFILDNGGAKRDMYIKDHPSLKERLIFVNAEPGTPEAATLIRNNPKDPTIPELIEKGYIIRTRADANTKEARQNDYSSFEAACKSGAQIITTDYYLPSKLFKSTYHVSFKGNKFQRKNPAFK